MTPEEERAAVVAGDRLYYVPAYRRDGVGYDVVVTKVGRKWAGFRRADAQQWQRDEGRFDIDTFAADGGGYSSPGQIYLSEEGYHEHRRLNARWAIIASHLRGLYGRPRHITDADMDKIVEILHLSYGEPG